MFKRMHRGSLRRPIMPSIMTLSSEKCNFDKDVLRQFIQAGRKSSFLDITSNRSADILVIKCNDKIFQLRPSDPNPCLR